MLKKSTSTLIFSFLLVAITVLHSCKSERSAGDYLLSSEESKMIDEYNQKIKSTPAAERILGQWVNLSDRDPVLSPRWLFKADGTYTKDYKDGLDPEVGTWWIKDNYLYTLVGVDTLWDNLNKLTFSELSHSYIKTDGTEKKTHYIKDDPAKITHKFLVGTWVNKGILDNITYTLRDDNTYSYKKPKSNISEEGLYRIMGANKLVTFCNGKFITETIFITADSARIFIGREEDGNALVDVTVFIKEETPTN